MRFETPLNIGKLYNPPPPPPQNNHLTRDRCVSLLGFHHHTEWRQPGGGHTENISDCTPLHEAPSWASNLHCASGVTIALISPCKDENVRIVSLACNLRTVDLLKPCCATCSETSIDWTGRRQDSDCSAMSFTMFNFFFWSCSALH